MVAEPGELVCDPFLGGGTTALAALSQGRNFVGADIDPSAIETAQGRLP
jgi:site-specific DNA-methyltransferase (adenine-specific)